MIPHSLAYNLRHEKDLSPHRSSTSNGSSVVVPNGLPGVGRIAIICQLKRFGVHKRKRSCKRLIYRIRAIRKHERFNRFACGIEFVGSGL